MYDPYAQFTKHVLPNKLEVHSLFKDCPWIILEVIVHSGGREDPVEKSGLAHFVEHMVSNNIPNLTFDQAKEFFDNCGGNVNFGVTRYSSTRYRFFIPADLDTLRQALAIFGSMIFDSQIEKNIDRERKVILSEFNGVYPFIESLKWETDIRKFLFKGHRLEKWNQLVGLPKEFLLITIPDLQDFYDKHYVPANVSLVVHGGIPAEDIIMEIQKSPFGIQKRGTRNKIPKPFQIPPISGPKTKIVKLSDYFNYKTDQAGYKAVWAFPSDFDGMARIVFNSMLKKILFEEIREKRGLAYNINANYSNFQNVFEYEVRGLINPEATSCIDELVQKCIKMIPLRQDLFDRCLRSQKQKYSMMDLSGHDLVDGSSADLALFNRIVPLQESWGDLHKVKFEQMAEAAALLSPERQYTFISCP
ncbi:MAG: insulinase family protein [Sphingobacteriia bacterium]|nr:insulinase family protein [Sphingobacteriia bacterium]